MRRSAPSARADEATWAFFFVLGVFFLSGVSALLYQVIWQRMLTLFSGADIVSVTIIVSAFMAGLGLGNLAGGLLADRVSPAANLWLFVGAEAAVGSYGLLSKTLYYDVLYTRLSFLSGSPLVGPVLFVSLLWPTFFMGASLPLLARAFTPTIAATGRVVGSLYGWNALGAATGAVVTTWSLLPRFGLTGALLVGAGVNAACAVGAILVAWRTQIQASRPVSRETDAAPLGSAPSLAFSFGTWTLIYGATGAAALALELVWFRMLGVMLKTTAFTFGTMLAVYLGGLGLGAVAGARLVTRSRRPATTFLALQVLLVVIAGLSVAALVAMIRAGTPAPLVEHLAGHDYDVERGVGAIRDLLADVIEPRQWNDLWRFLGLYVALPIALMGVPTVLMGLSFPYLQRATHADQSRVGRHVGILMTSNVAGSALGAAATGLVLLPQFGTATTLKGIIALMVIPCLLLTRQHRGLAVGLGSAVAGTLAVMPGSAMLWAAMHGTAPAQVFVAENGSGVSVLKEEDDDATWVFVNGLSQSSIPYGNIHTTLGALPLFIHPNPEMVAIIGLGSGNTAFSAAGRATVQQIICIEIVGTQRTLLRRHAAESSDPGIVSLLADRRVEHVVGDGRAYLLQTDTRFDIIEADALRPFSAYSGHLYSVEYFELLRRRLRPFGLAVTWAPTPRIRRTFLKVFPHVLAFEQIYIGSNEPIPFDPEVVRGRLATDEARAFYARAGIDIGKLLEPLLSGPVDAFDVRHDRQALDDLNHDLFPRDEFMLPRVLPF